MGQKLAKARAPRKAAETRSKAPKSREPVVHSVEWTTSSWEKGGNWAKSPKSREPVDHSFDWSTGSLCLRTNESEQAGQDFLAAHAA